MVCAGAVLLTSCSSAPDAAERQSTIHDAVGAGDLEAAAALLEAGADVDADLLSFTPLMRAAIRDDVAMVRLLLEFGADLDATTPEGLTAWHVAAASDSRRVLEFLIAEGVDLDRRSANGMNALNHAADAGAVDAIRVLADAGVDLDAPSEIITQGHGYPVDEGSTSLAIAARGGRLDAVAALLALGARVDARSAIDQTALAQAVVTGQAPDMIALLLNAGADPTIVVECATRCGSSSQNLQGWARTLGNSEVAALLDNAVADLE